MEEAASTRFAGRLSASVSGRVLRAAASSLLPSVNCSVSSSHVHAYCYCLSAGGCSLNEIVFRYFTGEPSFVAG